MVNSYNFSLWTMEENMLRKHILCAFGLTIAVVMAAGTSDDKSKQSGGGSSIVDLNASVQFTGSQFVITNKDSFDWNNCKFDLNGGAFSSGYILNTNVIKAQTTHTVGAMQFAKTDGERFNPFTHKPQSFSISCSSTASGKSGFYYGSWK